MKKTVIKTNWQTKKLGEVLTYEQPTKYIVNSTKYKDEYETPVLTAGKSFILGKTKEKDGIFPKNDLPVIIFDDFTTATKFVDFPFKVKSSAMKILHPVKNVSDAKFLFYIMQNINFDYTGIHKRYWISEYSNFKIPLPPLAEQRRIVKILDGVFEDVKKAKENAEKNLRNAKELFENYLQNVFTNPGKDSSSTKASADKWEKKKLGEVCNLKSGTTILKSLEKKSGDVLYVKVGDMNLVGNEVFIKNSSRFVDVEDINIKQIIPKGSIIFPKRGGAIFTNKRRKIIKPTIVDLNTMALVPFKIIDSEFLYYWFLRIDLSSLNNGSSIPQINNYSFDNVYIKFPKSLITQKQIVKKLDELSAQTKKLEAVYQQKIDDLEELKKSVLKKAFSKEL